MLPCITSPKALPLFAMVHNKATHVSRTCSAHGFLPEIYHQLLQGSISSFVQFPNPVRGQVAMLACPVVDDQGVLGDLWLINQKIMLLMI